MDMLMSQPATGEASPRRRLRLSEYGWGRKAFLIFAALIGSAAFAYAANLASRTALWQVVRVCTLDQTTRGSPLPCLEVSVADGVERGFVVLRPPFGEPDTILTPTRRIIGLEDPQLGEANLPNYFAFAWAARRWLAASDKPAPDDARVALAINSRLARSQDQLHIHIGCLAPSFAQTLHLQALGPQARDWRRGNDMAPGLELWTWRSGAKDFRDFDPIATLREKFGDETALRRTTLGVVQTASEFVAVALISRPGGWYASAEDLIESRC
jgi:CDP-diacylglycerol pyrophosphatase